MTKLAFTLTAAFAFAALAPARARAQDEDRCKEEQDAQSSGKNYKTVIGPDGRKIFVIERAFVVCGKVPKPQVIYVLQQRNINYEWETLKQEFLPKVLQALREEPF
jgi:hypothetical protein